MNSFTLSRSWSQAALPELRRLYTRERRRIKGGKIYRRQLKSAYQHYPHLPLPESAAEKNDAIQFEHWVHERSVK